MKLVKNREDIILPLCKNKDVLDVGCVGGGYHPGWLHGKICEVAASCLGIDTQREGIETVKKHGFDAVWGDAETVNLGREFDVIVAGEVLEHISNQGKFFDNMRKHLKDDGVMILTTPNALSFVYPLQCLFTSLEASPEHIMFHTEETLRSISERHGWMLKDICYWKASPKNLKGKMFVSLASWLLPPRLSGHYIIAILAKS